MPLGTVLMHNYSWSLIPSIVAANLFEFAIADALVRLHFDKGLDLHPNGVSNDDWLCPLSHMIYSLVCCRTKVPFVSAPPLGRKKEDGHLLGVVSVFQSSLTRLVNHMTMQR